MDAVTQAHDGKVQMIDSSIVRVQQHASGAKKTVEIVVWGEAAEGCRRRSMRGSTAKAGRSQILINAWTSPRLDRGEPLLTNLAHGTIVIADKAYDADRLRAHIKARGAIANIPNMIRRKKRFRWTKALYRQRNQIERFFNSLKQFRRIATRYDKLGANFLAFIQLATVRLCLRSIESTP
jgi:transposase